VTGVARRGRLLLMLAAFLLTSAEQSYAQISRSAPVDYKAIPKLEEMKDRSAAPDFTLPNAQGKKLSLKDYRGKLVLLNFWATWCTFCKEEMPGMERLYREFKDSGFEIVAVNVKDKRNDALAFVKKLQLTYTVMMDPAGEVGLLYGAWGMPTTYLIDEKGTVLARMWGPADWYSPGARNLIKTLLDKKRSS
jgi:DsbE subfamily thiol:disulfide oxidoreductase